LCWKGFGERLSTSFLFFCLGYLKGRLGSAGPPFVGHLMDSCRPAQD
jgi:hypothetical protein